MGGEQTWALKPGRSAGGANEATRSFEYGELVTKRPASASQEDLRLQGSAGYKAGGRPTTKKRRKESSS